MSNVFLEISLILVAVTVLSVIMQLLRQPLIIGYIIAGLLAGPFALRLVNSTETLEVFSQIGISFLLFIIGLGLNPRIIREVGKPSFITGIGQVIFTSLIGYFIGLALGLAPITAFYVAVALTFSSTIIVLKLLSDKRETHRLYAKISIGFLLIQDLVAALVLLTVHTLMQGTELTSAFTRLGVVGVLLTALLFIFGHFILPRLQKFLTQSTELLFVFAISWGLGISTLFNILGFSMEIGALAAGVTLAASPFAPAIASRLSPLRDFFIILFFVLLGASIQLQDVMGNLFAASVFSLFVLVGNPLIVMLLMKWMKYSSEVGFKAGLAVAQISEFSLILIALAHAAGYADSSAVALVTLVGIFTIAGSTYMIIFADNIYKALRPYLKFFEVKKSISDQVVNDDAEILLCGYKGIGREFLYALQKLDKPFMVVDYDPDIVNQLRNEKAEAIYGDIADKETLQELNISSMKMVISLVPNIDANLILARYMKELNPTALFIAYARGIEDAKELYDAGASYVVMPQYLGSMTACSLIEKKGIDKKSFAAEKKRHLSFLRSALKRLNSAA